VTKNVIPRIAWAAFAFAIFGTEFLIATRWTHVPFVREDFGDYLVTVLLYAMAKSLRDWKPLPLASGIFAFSVLVEFSQAIHLADRLGFARGSVASIVLGNSFQWSDIAMYGAGCLTAWLLDTKVRA